MTDLPQEGEKRPEKTVIIIPARMASTRLPGKPMALIGDKPMIVHVAERAVAANVGDVAVATDSQEVARAVEQAGHAAILTRGDHPSGSDRIFEALNILDPQMDVTRIVNLQGDLPTLDPALVRSVVAPLDDSQVDIATLGAQITIADEMSNPNVVKIVATPTGPKRLRALYFTRATAPYGDGPLFHHIGIYAYRRQALARFVDLPPSTLELRERLEQLRALEAGMRIDATIVDTVPLGVDTPPDLERARKILG